MLENYANQPQSAIVINYLCENMVESKRKRGYGVLLF